MKSPEIKNTAMTYNFWIYLLTCLLVAAVMIKLAGRDSGAGLDLGDIVFILVRMVFFAALAWFIGEKYRLNYLWVCGLSVLLLLLAIFIWELCAMLFFHFSFSFELIAVTIFLVFSGLYFWVGRFLLFHSHFNFSALNYNNVSENWNSQK
jgi:hypothetical protein